METKPKTYKEEIIPLWGNEIREVLDWRNPMSALVKIGILLGGLAFAYWLTENLDNLIESLATAAGGIIFLVVGLLPILMYTYVRASRKLYDNQVEKRKKLGEFIENPFDTIGREPYMKNTGEPRWASIDIINKTSLIISKCYVEMSLVTDSKGKRAVPIVQNLKWSHSHGVSNRTKEAEVYRSPKICDVAVAVPDRNQILFETWAGEYWADIGIYNITVDVHGLYNGFLRDATYNYVLEYKGGNLINILKEGQEKWRKDQLNPMPHQQTPIKKTINKKSSSKRTSSRRSNK